MIVSTHKLPVDAATLGGGVVSTSPVDALDPAAPACGDPVDPACESDVRRAVGNDCMSVIPRFLSPRYPACVTQHMGKATLMLVPHATQTDTASTAALVAIDCK